MGFGDRGAYQRWTSSPPFKGLLMSKVNQIKLEEGSGHQEARALGHVDKPDAPQICRAGGVGMQVVSPFTPVPTLGSPNVFRPALHTKRRVCQAPSSGWGTLATLAQRSPSLG